MPKFSIIMPCFLGEYKGAASNREAKLIRSIESVISQSFKDWELIIVADGCEKTYEMIEANYSDNSQIDCLLIPKQPQWSGYARNLGTSAAKGEYIVYLDSDDCFGSDHLKMISDNIDGRDWVWFNDYVKTNDGQIERTVLINQKYQYGTSNLCHKRSMGAKWTSVGYGMDDWSLGQHLMRLSNNSIKIPTPEYIVCHIPNKIDL